MRVDDNVDHHRHTAATVHRPLTSYQPSRAGRLVRLKNGRSCWHSAFDDRARHLVS